MLRHFRPGRMPISALNDLVDRVNALPTQQPTGGGQYRPKLVKIGSGRSTVTLGGRNYLGYAYTEVMLQADATPRVVSDDAEAGTCVDIWDRRNLGTDDYAMVTLVSLDGGQLVSVCDPMRAQAWGKLAAAWEWSTTAVLDVNPCDPDGYHVDTTRTIRLLDNDAIPRPSLSAGTVLSYLPGPPVSATIIRGVPIDLPPWPSGGSEHMSIYQDADHRPNWGYVRSHA